MHRLLLLLVIALVAAPTASAAGILDRAAAQLRTDPVYVDPAARNVVPPAAERRIQHEIENARAGPVYVVVLPEAAAREAGGDPVEAIRTIAQTLHRRGTYAGLIGDHFRALSNVLPRGEAGKLATEAFQAHHAEGIAPTLVDFVDRVAAARNGGGTSSSGSSTPWTLIIIVGVIAVIGFFVVSGNRRKKQAQLGAVKQVAREDLVALAEDVQDLEHRVEGNPKAREAYDRALASYERASGSFDRARSQQQLASVAEALDEGRYEMAVAEAELAGRTPPERRPPCFFDPRHGPSTRDVEWAPAGGTPRPVPACEADAQRVERGEDPASRQVPVGGAMVPYWSSPMYGGYFGGFLPGLLIGESLGGWGGAPVVIGDNTSSGDGFDSGDFGGGGFGGGDFGGGGGDSGGGGGDF